MSYPIRMVSAQGAEADYEQLGTKSKFWLTGAEWGTTGSLFKYSRLNTGEHWSEKCAAEICAVMGIEHVAYDLALCDDKWGVVSPNFVPPGMNLMMGNQLLQSYDQNYSDSCTGHFSVSERYTIKEVLECLKYYEEDKTVKWIGASGQDLFCQYVLLDVIVGNQDRHHENWAILEGTADRVRKMSPTYDHASSLGRELLDEKREKRLSSRDRNFTVEAFATKAKTHFRDEITGKKLSTLDALLRVLKYRPDLAGMCREKVELLDDEAIDQVFNNVPEQCITETARKFAVGMVKANVRRVKENV